MKQTIFYFMGILLFLIACSPTSSPMATPPSPTSAVITLLPTSLPPPTSVLSITTALPFASPTSNMAIRQTIDAPLLSQTGPWLIVIYPDGVVALNSDGSAPTPLVSDAPILPTVNQTTVALSPDERWLAYLLAASETRPFPELHLLDLQTRVDRLVTPLLADGSRLPASSPPTICLDSESTPNREAALCQIEATVGDLAWSPDSQKLAFVSAHLSTSADLSLYTVADGQLRQLSAEADQASLPVWSPDSQRLFYFTVDYSFAVGTESQKMGWVVALDGMPARALVERLPAQSEKETVVGWWNVQTVLLHSEQFFCGHSLRALDTHSGQVKPIWQGFFAGQGVAFDPQTGNLLLEVDSCGEENAGIYFIPQEGPPSFLGQFPTLPQTHLASNSLLGVFYFPVEQGWELVDSHKGTLEEWFLAEGVPPFALRAPDFDLWSGNSGWLTAETTGLWIYNYATGGVRQIFPQPIHQFALDPTATHLFFLTDDTPTQLYQTIPTDFVPTPLPIPLPNDPDQILLFFAHPQP